MILGVIADDFTGATDVASMLVRAGMQTVQVLGVPAAGLPEADAVVVALKTRTIPAADAVAQSLQALEALRRAGARQIYFKYCSTFDSTAEGNIGPVTDALMAALDAGFTIACPAFPENGRTVFRGHLFVGDQLLSDSGMRNHPLTPMTDANLVRVLQSQTAQRVGLLRYDGLQQNAADAVGQLRTAGIRIAVADAARILSVAPSWSRSQTMKMERRFLGTTRVPAYLRKSPAIHWPKGPSVSGRMASRVRVLCST